MLDTREQGVFDKGTTKNGKNGVGTDESLRN
jgi:hypothetical protein